MSSLDKQFVDRHRIRTPGVASIRTSTHSAKPSISIYLTEADAGRGLSSLSVCTNRLKEGTEQSPNRPSLRSTDLDPTHVVLLHLLHLLLDRGVQLVLELERLHVVHVAVTVEEVAVKDGARLLLGVSRRLGLVLVVPVTAVPVGTRGADGLIVPVTAVPVGTRGADGLIVPVTAVPVGTRGADGLIVPVTAVPVGTRGADGLIVPVTAVPVGTRGADGLIVPVTAVPVGTRGADGLVVPVTAVPVGTRGADGLIVPVTAVPVGTRGGSTGYSCTCGDATERRVQLGRPEARGQSL